MPLCNDLVPDEDEDLDHWKFLDCRVCVNRFKPRTCADCDNGEHFEEEEMDGIDKLFAERSAW